MIRGGKPEDESTVSMGKWLGMHLLRSVTVDLPAVICFVVAALSVGDVVI
jgi:hypothetical protein